MQDTSDFRQTAALKCIKSGRLNSANPYSGGYYHAAYRSATCESHRRQLSQERRVASFFDSSPCRERYWPEQRYEHEGLNSDDPAKIVEAREELDLQRQAIGRLAPDDRAIVVQRDLQALSAADVALDRSETEAAIRSRHYHARQRLAAALTRYRLAY